MLRRRRRYCSAWSCGPARGAILSLHRGEPHGGRNMFVKQPCMGFLDGKCVQHKPFDSKKHLKGLQASKSMGGLSVPCWQGAAMSRRIGKAIDCLAL